MSRYNVQIFLVMLLVIGVNWQAMCQDDNGYSEQSGIKLIQTEIDSLKQVASHTMNDSVLWRTHKHLAVIYMRMGDFYNALLYIDKSDSLSELIDNIMIKAMTHYFYGSILTQIGSLDASSDKCKQALALFELSHDTAWISNTYNSLGVIQYNKKKLDSAKYYFNMAYYKSAYKEKHSGYPLCNIGGLYALDEKYDTALYYYQLGLKSALITQNNSLRSTCWANMSEAYMLQGEYELSNMYLDSSILQDKMDNSIYTLYQRYYDRALVYKAMKNLDSATLYFERHIDLRSKIYNRNQFGKLAELQISNATLKKNQEVLQAKNRANQMALELEKRKQRIWFLGSISFFIMLILLGIFLKYKTTARKKEQLFLKDKQLLKMENTLAQTEIENQKLKEEHLNERLKYQERDLTSLALNIARKKEFTADILEEVRQVMQLNSQEQKKALRNLKLVLIQNLDEGETLDKFQKNIQSINARYYANLTKLFPGLTQNEINTCGLFRLGLSTKEIARIKNISVKSAEMARYRIRKKLGLEADQDLIEFLKGI